MGADRQAVTRKRFVKLLMSDGYERNFAEQVALEARYRRMSYLYAYVTYKLG